MDFFNSMKKEIGCLLHKQYEIVEKNTRGEHSVQRLRPCRWLAEVECPSPASSRHQPQEDEDGSNNWVPAPMREIWVDFLAPGPGTRSELVGKNYLSLSLNLSGFQILF